MIRFFINFFAFGFLFFLIYLYFPEAFGTLVKWAQEVFHWLKSFVVETPK